MWQVGWVHILNMSVSASRPVTSPVMDRYRIFLEGSKHLTVLKKIELA